MKAFAIRDHVSVYWQIYLAVASIIFILIAILIFSNYRSEQRKEIQTWPKTEALIIKSKLDFLNVASDSKALSRISADLILRYKASSLTYETRYIRSWPLTALNDFKTDLAEGKYIEIRYSPLDPKVVSLYPLVAE